MAIYKPNDPLVLTAARNRRAACVSRLFMFLLPQTRGSSAAIVTHGHPRPQEGVLLVACRIGQIATLRRRAKWSSGGTSGRRISGGAVMVLTAISASAGWSGHGQWWISQLNS